MTRLRAGIARSDDVLRYADESRNELYDLPGAPLPDADTPAPPRLLPMWDETLLAYRDRSRVLPESYRKRVIVKAGDVLPTYTIDGFVAGLWWAEADAEGRSRIVLEPFEPMSAMNRAALEDEAARLAAFLQDREPTVYARFRHSARRHERSLHVSAH